MKSFPRISIYIPLSLAAILLYQNCAPSGPTNTIQTNQPSVSGSELKGVWAGPCVDLGPLGGPADLYVQTTLRIDDGEAGNFHQIDTVFRKFDDQNNSYGACASQLAKRNVFEAKGRYAIRPISNGVYEIDYAFSSSRDGQIVQPTTTLNPTYPADAAANASSCHGIIGRVSQKVARSAGCAAPINNSFNLIRAIRNVYGQHVLEVGVTDFTFDASTPQTRPRTIQDGNNLASAPTLFVKQNGI
jgi:hypothetical protein